MTWAASCERIISLKYLGTGVQNPEEVEMADRILIPLDGSKFGEAALHSLEEQLKNLDPKVQPEVTLLQVVSPHYLHINVEGGIVDVLDRSENIEETKAKAAAYLEKAGETLRASGIKVVNKVVVNDKSVSAAEIIIGQEEALGVDLVAMSTHGRRGITRWAIGSVAEKVLKGGGVPVLMVRAR